MSTSNTLSALDSGLRIAQVLTYPFGFALLIAHTGVTHDHLPALALIPFTFSFLFSTLIVFINSLRKAHECTNGVSPLDKMSERKKKAWKAVVWIMDVVLGASLMALCVVSWVHLGEYGGWWYRYHAPDMIVLAAYGLVPVMGNMCIHFFFALRTVYSFLPKLSFPSPVCPHCHKNFRTGEEAPPARWLGGSGPAGYSILRAEETDSLYRDGDEGLSTARPSMEPGRQETGVTTRDLTADASADIAREVSDDEVRQAIDV